MYCTEVTSHGDDDDHDDDDLVYMIPPRHEAALCVDHGVPVSQYLKSVDLTF